MGAKCDVSIKAELTGLGQDQRFSKEFRTTTPVLSMYNYDSIGLDAEALDISDITAIELICMKNIDETNYVEIDCNYTASTFRANLRIGPGQTAVFKPSGIIYAQANTAAVKVEYLIVASA